MKIVFLLIAILFSLTANAVDWVRTIPEGITPVSGTVSVSSSALPTGAATESTLSTVNGKLSTTINGLKVDGSAVNQPVIPLVAAAAVSAANPMPVQQTATPTAPPYLDLAAIATGAYPGKTPFAVDGRATAINNARVDVIEFGTSYTPPASPIQMQVVSTSANDTALGSGIRSVIIHYLDTSYAVQSTIVTLNGLTPVLTTPTNILRVNGMHAYTTAGLAATAAGNISLQAVGGATTYSYIAAGYRTSRSAVFTIPAGKTGYIYSFGASSGATTGTHYTQVSLMATSHEGVALPNVPIVQQEVGTLNGGVNSEFRIMIKVPATMDVKAVAVSDASNANASVLASFDGWYE